MMLSKFAGMKKFILGENMQTAADVVGLLKLDYILNSCMEKRHYMKGDTTAKVIISQARHGRLLMQWNFFDIFVCI